MGIATLFATTAVILPAATDAAEYRLEQSVGTEVSVTDNIDLDPDGEKTAGVVNTLSYGTEFSAEGRRLNLSLLSDLAVESENAENLSLDQDVRAFGSMEVFEDFFFLEASASSTQTVIDSGSAVSGERGADDDDTASVHILEASPYIQQRFGRWADGEFRVRHTETRVTGEEDEDDTSNERDMQQTLTVTSGSVLNRLELELELDRQKTILLDRDGPGSDIEERLGSLTTNYAFTRFFTGIARFGYVDVDDGGTRDLSGELWDVGFELTGTRGSLLLTYGRRYNDDRIEAQLDYEITPRLRVFGSLDRTLDTSLGSIANDRRGDPLEPTIGLSPSDLGEDLDEGASLVTSGELGLVGNYGRNSFGLTAGYTDREFETREENTLTLVANWSRSLSRDLSSSLIFDASQVDEDDEERERTFSGTARLSYSLAENARVFTGVSRTQRFSGQAEDEYTENTIFFGGSLGF
ncbi:porin family protein [Algihabitans albus]|uniref:hypothetical protein n=1 Tax=Algihabitans albus TaxID=2164067 RepID=UPI000E5C80AF|nr:hypothetical protein [Algihabitans albus]